MIMQMFGGESIICWSVTEAAPVAEREGDLGHCGYDIAVRIQDGPLNHNDE